ncbi:hypothetical protein [Sinimarinibacterium sp. NLF-5-8]|uniref:hypothetical protein n=1 Tax=Sinimarinibacterium sp. NLF-5-8 TaxID=2698684 RepID=UPI00137C12A1|nr:hypothetical protein [Sinimarinibacterium sp. NLF-5-8]QHS09103.1 hypothetical protein GT972_02345 [Sinimarinibacterium sp. NLF-5-8]
MKMTAKYILPRLLSAAFAALLGFLYFAVADEMNPGFYSDGTSRGLTNFDGYAWAAIILCIPAWGWGAMNTLFWLKSGKHRQAMKVLAAFTFIALVGTSVWLGFYGGQYGIVNGIVPVFMMTPLYLLLGAGFAAYFHNIPLREDFGEMPEPDPHEFTSSFSMLDTNFDP